MKKSVRSRFFLFFLLALLCFLNGCRSQPKPTLGWRDREFSADLSGQSFCGDFSATVVRSPDGGTVLYHDPALLRGVTLTVSGSVVTVSRGELSTDLSADSVAALLLPYRMLCSPAEIRTLREPGEDHLLTLVCSDLPGTVEVTQSADGLPRFLSHPDCRFAVTDIRF